MKKPKLIRSAEYDHLGQDRRKLATLQRKGVLVRVRRGNYVDAAEWQTLSRREQYGLRVLTFGQQAVQEPVYCHATAALLWGLWIVGMPQKIHTRTEVTTSGRSSKEVTRHIGSCTEGIQRCGPFLVTDKLSTTMQLIDTLAFPYAVAVCDSSLRPRASKGNQNVFTSPESDPFQHWPEWDPEVPQGLPLTVAQLRAAADALPSRAARDRALKVIEFASALSGSAGESLSRVKMFRLGFPTPILQEPFELRDGKTAKADFWFKEKRIVGEIDGLGKYLKANWSGGLSLADRIIAEKRRENQIRAQGVGFARWDWKELMDTETFASILRQAGLRQSGPRTGPWGHSRKMP
ncbi:hypothetical protein ACX80D_02415 [Arthrobacter sp. Sr24]